MTAAKAKLDGLSM